jgi:hypothetical protein
MSHPIRSRAAGTLRIALLVAAASLGTGAWSESAGQDIRDIRFQPRKSHPLDRGLAEFLERGSADVWTRDTVISRDGAVAGDVLILEAVARVAGHVEGDVYVVDGDLFLRPGAEVGGDIVVLGGGYYGSGMARVDGRITWRPAERYSVMPADGGIEIHPVVDLPDPVTLHGLYGFKAPTYQRVDALTVSWGLTFQIPTWAWRPSLEMVGRYRSGQGDFEGTVRQYWHPGPVEFGLEAERVTRSNESWIRGDVSNSLAYLFTGDDFRDYYTADRAAFVVRGGDGAWWTPALRIEWEKAASRRAGDHFTLFGSDDVRSNPDIDDGETWSAALGVEVDRATGRRGRLTGSVVLEAADSTVAGEFSYVLGDLRARWRTPGFGRHEVDIFVLGHGDLSGALPGQRWTGFGGRATLPTIPVMGFRGARVVYGHLGYEIPIEVLRAGELGAPGVFVRAATGAAWDDGQSADFRTNLTAGLRFWVVEVAMALDPETDGGDVTGYAVFRFPGDL